MVPGKDTHNAPVPEQGRPWVADVTSTKTTNDNRQQDNRQASRQTCFQRNQVTHLETYRSATTKQKRHYVVVRKNEKQKTSIWDRWQNYETYRESQLATDWSDARVR